MVLLQFSWKSCQDFRETAFLYSKALKKMTRVKSWNSSSQSVKWLESIDLMSCFTENLLVQFRTGLVGAHCRAVNHKQGNTSHDCTNTVELMAVRIVMMICTMLFHVSFFIIIHFSARPLVAFLLRQASPFGMPSGTFRSKTIHFSLFTIH